MLKKIIWIFTLLAHEFVLIYLVYSNKIAMFLNPKMNKYIYFSIVIIFLLLLVELYDVINKHYYSKVGVGIVVFLIPLTLTFYHSYAVGDSITKAQTRDVIGMIDTDKLQPTEAKSVFDGMSEVEEGEYFMDMLNACYKDLYENDFRNYDGKEIEMSGMVYYNDGLKDNEFVISRLLMSCCAADATYVGFLSEYDGKKSLKQGDWIRVRGVMKKGSQYNAGLQREETVPKIYIKSIESMDPPKSEYVYP